MSAVLQAREPDAKYLVTRQSPLAQHFDLLATAPGGVARLRELILTSSSVLSLACTPLIRPAAWSSTLLLTTGVTFWGSTIDFGSLNVTRSLLAISGLAE